MAKGALGRRSQKARGAVESLPTQGTVRSPPSPEIVNLQDGFVEPLTRLRLYVQKRHR